MDGLQSRKREIWVDNVKVIACILVVLGHFFQSMLKAGLISRTYFFDWFMILIYYFHVPLFFICSGYLYQKLNKIDDARDWINNIVKKAINLMIPYFVFSIVTLLMKTVFKGSVNSEPGGIVQSLFLRPVAPYWFLYVLFFVFVITPVFNSARVKNIVLTAALALKLAFIFIGEENLPYVIGKIMENEIWFVIGACMAYKGIGEKSILRNLNLGIVSGIVFLALSTAVFFMSIKNGIAGFILGFIACISVASIMISLYWEREKSIFDSISPYTMPVFLMHTIFAATMRSLLFKAGIDNTFIHIVIGLGAAFGGPVVAAVIMKKSKILEIFIYPGRFIKVRI